MALFNDPNYYTNTGTLTGSNNWAYTVSTSTTSTHTHDTTVYPALPNYDAFIEQNHCKLTVDSINEKWDELGDWIKIYLAQNHPDLCEKTKYRFHALLHYRQKELATAAYTSTWSSSVVTTGTTGPTYNLDATTWNNGYNSGTVSITTNVSPYTSSAGCWISDSTSSLSIKSNFGGTTL